MQPYDDFKLGVHPEANLDLSEHVDYLVAEGFSDKQLLAFHREVARAFDKILSNPTTWSFSFRSKRVRKVQIPRFRIQVFYSIKPDGQPYVLEVAGPGRLPRWRERL